jgi:uncharacterized protein DUF5985
MKHFIAGAMCMAALTIALFFTRFWRKTLDRFFGFFCAAFYLIALERFALVFFNASVDNQYFLYTIRLAAFVLIIIAILDKNRAPPKDGGTQPKGRELINR